MTGQGLEETSRMPTLIDWSEVDAEVTSALSRYSCEHKSQALAYVVLRALFGYTADEIEDAITDGPDDRGIDAVIIQDTERPRAVHLFQFKYVANFERTSDNFPSGEVDKLLSFVRDLLSREKALETTCNPLLWEKIPEIWDLFESGPPPHFVVHFVANQASMVSTHQRRVEEALRPYRYFTVDHTDLPALASLLIEKRRPSINADIRLVDNQYFERSDGNIRGLIATVQGRELVELIRDKQHPEQVNLEVFDQNVRIYLTLKNRINRKIFETASSPSNAEFWYLNNGVTMTCESFEYPPGVRAPLVKLRGVQIVNGGQTSNALFEAEREAPEAFDRVLILLRIYELKNRDVAARVAESTNSQTPIRSRDLRANDDIQRKLEVAFLGKGYFYERKAEQHKEKPRLERIDALAAAQAFVAYCRAWPEVATKDRGKIFGELYDAIFNDDLTAEHLLASTKVFERILEQKRNLEHAIRKGQPFEARHLFLIDGAYYVLFAAGNLCELAGLNPLDVAKALLLLDQACLLVEQVVEIEKQRDAAFAHKRFFKSARARVLIADACRTARTKETPSKA